MLLIPRLLTQERDVGETLTTQPLQTKKERKTAHCKLPSWEIGKEKETAYYLWKEHSRRRLLSILKDGGQQKKYDAI